MNLIYENKYGRLEIEIISPYKDVSKMYSKDFDESCFFTLDEAEKIALITGNRDIQLCFSRMNDSYRVALLHHKSSSSAALCKISNLEFDSAVNPAKELDWPAI